MADDRSLTAQNIKIVTRDGRVTLRGPVASDDEKSRIAQFAADVVGAERVSNQLDVNRRS
jgi:osmotically-inducible protein OsmY